MAAENARRRVTFTLDAPGAREVFLCGTFNEWSTTKHPMKPEKDGCWKAQVMLLPGRYEYRMLVDGRWVNDPGADACVPNPFGSSNCVREVPAAGK